MQKEIKDYEMYSAAGNRACQSVVNSITKKILGSKRVTEDTILDLFNKGRMKIAEKHGEVYDTEPRYHMQYRINAALKDAGYSFYL